MEAWEHASAGKSEVSAGCRCGMWGEMSSGKIGEVQGKGGFGFIHAIKGH